MIVPNYSQEKIVDEEGLPTENFASFLRNMLQNMQLSLSDEGYWIPSVTSEPNSAGVGETQLGVLAASYQPAGAAVNTNSLTVTVGVQVGTIVFDPYELNGGSVGPPRVPKGQLKVFLVDTATTGSFHAIVNL